MPGNAQNIDIGFVPMYANNYYAESEFTSANRRRAFGYFCPADKTVSKVKARVHYKGGTLAASDYKLEIYSHETTNNKPNASLVSATLGSAPTPPATVEWSISQALTAGTQYWFVFSNANASPGTNYWAIRFLGYETTSNHKDAYSSSGNGFGYDVMYTDDLFTNVSGTPSGFGIRLEFTDGSFFGDVVVNHSGPGSSTSSYGVYSAREVGIKFTTPAGGKIRVRGAKFHVHKNGTPTGNLRYRLYEGTNLVATTYTMPPGSISGSLDYLIPLHFSSVQELSASTTYRLVASETTQTDSSSNYYGLGWYQWDSSDSNMAPLKPFFGTAEKTIYDSGWTDTSDEFMVCGLILAPDVPTAAGGGLRPNLYGGFIA